MKLLLDSGADTHIADQFSQYTALHTAVLKYPHLQQDAVHLLIEYGANPNAQIRHGATPLHLVDAANPAYDCRSIEMARILLDHGADVNAQNWDERTPLHIAASGGTQAETLAAMYLAHNANVNATDFYGITPLHLAVSKKKSRANIRIVELLLKSGADVNARSVKGRTPLHLAVDAHAPNEVFEWLFEHGADWNSSNGETSLDTPLKKMKERMGDTRTSF
ncbi:Ankyrin-1 [Penicillium digitatum]|uniref:Uncharacterized protein n=3 Tax=Penicillium digitatum TaxID=36651 RepID=K9FK84_PEND2|nr:hypothetical protein PDIP_68460 [Penicillium digitatum Pd1]EKV08441.1 hypothetical protein PDIP_68460 [Penicillium digitatum Pd1]EKV09950.1 hypothetical protein PDIG_59020 [Penicillium digitatum PHI26]QQK41725.1 Ankyrin-1 [Penicillium digitatum]